MPSLTPRHASASRRRRHARNRSPGIHRLTRVCHANRFDISAHLCTTSPSGWHARPLRAQGGRGLPDSPFQVPLRLVFCLRTHAFAPLLSIGCSCRDPLGLFHTRPAGKNRTPTWSAPSVCGRGARPVARLARHSGPRLAPGSGLSIIVFAGRPARPPEAVGLAKQALPPGFRLAEPLPVSSMRRSRSVVSALALSPAHLCTVRSSPGRRPACPSARWRRHPVAVAVSSGGSGSVPVPLSRHLSTAPTPGSGPRYLWIKHLTSAHPSAHLSR